MTHSDSGKRMLLHHVRIKYILLIDISIQMKYTYEIAFSQQIIQKSHRFFHYLFQRASKSK